ncbi:MULTISPECIES: hypothetical protein [Ralstonia]|jgi:hypothetical protein|uniref:Uncharacterized protein n=2 Tax=Ralstonia pickettii TaxID=329 RepID=R0E9G1_RALPI|nr:hypothetical protein [Ralstonia pickettii]ENZ78037.1 hypothetical protein OR214_02313 [Ralstonia pickettii OR214]MCM3581877.1 hypothetical protein [Ralstonia pickettii]
MARQFECIWSKHFTNPGTRVVEMEYFLDPETRTRVEDARKVNCLVVGQELQLYDGELVVKRVS